MERVYQNHPEVAFASDSDEDPQSYVLRNEPSNHIGSVQFGSNHDFRPTQYGPTPILRPPGVYIINSYPPYGHDNMNAANLLTYGSQYNYLQQPIFQRNPRKFQDGLLAAKNFYNRGEPAAKCFRGQHIQRPELFYGNSRWFSSGDNTYAKYQSNVHNEGRPFTESCFFPSAQGNENFSALNQDTVNGFSQAGCKSGWDSNLVDDRGTQDTYHEANLTQSNILPMQQGSMEEKFPLPEDHTLYSLSKGAYGDTGNISEDIDRDFEGYDADTEPVGQNYSQQQHGNENGEETNPTEPSVVPLRTSRSTIRAKQKGQQGNTQRIKSIRKHAPRVRVRNRKVSVPRLVYLMKTKAQLAASRSKKCNTPMSPTPIDHIIWDGFDEESESAGQNCPLCDKDLSYAPTEEDDYGYLDELIDEPPNLPVVAVLSCGHVFHSECLELNIPEELSTDPPCFLCLSYGD